MILYIGCVWIVLHAITGSNWCITLFSAAMWAVDIITKNTLLVPQCYFFSLFFLFLDCFINPIFKLLKVWIRNISTFYNRFQHVAWLTFIKGKQTTSKKLKLFTSYCLPSSCSTSTNCQRAHTAVNNLNITVVCYRLIQWGVWFFSVFKIILLGFQNHPVQHNNKESQEETRNSVHLSFYNSPRWNTVAGWITFMSNVLLNEYRGTFMNSRSRQEVVNTDEYTQQARDAFY